MSVTAGPIRTIGRARQAVAIGGVQRHAGLIRTLHLGQTATVTVGTICQQIACGNDVARNENRETLYSTTALNVMSNRNQVATTN